VVSAEQRRLAAAAAAVTQLTGRSLLHVIITRALLSISDDTCSAFIFQQPVSILTNIQNYAFCVSLQCVDAVSWVTRTASGLAL